MKTAIVILLILTSNYVHAQCYIGMGKCQLISILEKGKIEVLATPDTAKIQYVQYQQGNATRTYFLKDTVVSVCLEDVKYTKECGNLVAAKKFYNSASNCEKVDEYSWKQETPNALYNIYIYKNDDGLGFKTIISK
jgi:hypothetical protein